MCPRLWKTRRPAICGTGLNFSHSSMKALVASCPTALSALGGAKTQDCCSCQLLSESVNSEFGNTGQSEIFTFCKRLRRIPSLDLVTKKSSIHHIPPTDAVRQYINPDYSPLHFLRRRNGRIRHRQTCDVSLYKAHMCACGAHMGPRAPSAPNGPRAPWG